jgi:hypothetical protein
MLLSFLLVKGLRLAGITSCDCSEVDADLGTEHPRVFEAARAAGLNDGLEVGLDEQGTAAEVEAIGQFDNRLVMLAASGTRQLSILKMGSR